MAYFLTRCTTMVYCQVFRIMVCWPHHAGCKEYPIVPPGAHNQTALWAERPDYWSGFWALFSDKLSAAAGLFFSVTNGACIFENSTVIVLQIYCYYLVCTNLKLITAKNKSTARFLFHLSKKKETERHFKWKTTSYIYISGHACK